MSYKLKKYQVINMQKKPLISAVIITYNQENYIAQTIDSILAQQTEYEFEIVIGEDCSTDCTKEIVFEYQKRYPDKIRVITSERNVGLLENYCRTIKASRGKYIAGCAGDDYWQRIDKLQKQVKFLEENPDYGMVHSDTDILKEDEGILIKNVYSKHKEHFNNKIYNTLDLLFMGAYPIVAPTAVFKKQFFDDYFDIEELKKNDIMMEDMPLWIFIAARSEIHYMSESFAVHREMKGTITNPKTLESKLKVFESCQKCFVYFYEPYKSYIKNPEINRKLIDQNFNRKYQKLAMEANRKDLVRKFYRCIIEQSGSSYLTTGDKIRYCFTYIPIGTHIYNYLKSFIPSSR